MLNEKCEKCGSEGLTEIDGEFVCEDCGSTYSIMLNYEGWYEEGSDTLRFDKNPHFDNI